MAGCQQLREKLDPSGHGFAGHHHGVGAAYLPQAASGPSAPLPRRASGGEPPGRSSYTPRFRAKASMTVAARALKTRWASLSSKQSMAVAHGPWQANIASRPLRKRPTAVPRGGRGYHVRVKEVVSVEHAEVTPTGNDPKGVDNAAEKLRASQPAEKILFCIRARPYRLPKNSCFVSGHDLTGCRRIHVLYQGTTLQAAEEFMFCIRARPYRLPVSVVSRPS